MQLQKRICFGLLAPLSMMPPSVEVIVVIPVASEGIDVMGNVGARRPVANSTCFVLISPYLAGMALELAFLFGANAATVLSSIAIMQSARCLSDSWQLLVKSYLNAPFISDQIENAD